METAPSKNTSSRNRNNLSLLVREINWMETVSLSEIHILDQAREPPYSLGKLIEWKHPIGYWEQQLSRKSASHQPH